MIDREVADDFDVVGSLQSIKAQGEYSTYFNGPAMNFQGVYVRFYEWQNGVPGALQYERLIAPSAVTVTSDSTGVFTMQIPLPTAFTASGRHFLSIQTVSDLGWWWRTANGGSARLAAAKVRERTPAGGWANANGSDVAFTLYGTLTGPPQLLSISDATLPRSGRLRLFGSNFGSSTAPGEVRIGSLRAIVTHWSNVEIHAYVPEALTPGTYDVQVVTALGSSATFPLAVTNRTPPGGHALWRFQADSIDVSTDAVVAPDGTIYVMDDSGNLYALTPDGGLIWATKSGGQGSKLTRGFDGTLYTMADGVLRATNPDGTHKWDFTAPDLNWTNGGPTVGPDGNIYAYSQYAAYGFFSVTPEGQLRWRHPEILDREPHDHFIVFSEGQAYLAGRIHPDPGTWLMAFRMSDGAFVWKRDADRKIQPLIGPAGRIYTSWDLGVWYSLVYDPNGNLLRQDEIDLGQRRFSTDLTKLYATTPTYAKISALDSANLNVLWTFDNGGSVSGPPTPDPFGRFVVARATTNGAPSNLLTLSSSGEFLWRDSLPTENGANIVLSSGPVFSPNGNVAYTGATLPSYNPVDYCYVYAFQISSPTAPAPIRAVSRKVHGSAGTFDVPLPLTGTPGVECRAGGKSGEHQLVLTFARPITANRASVIRGNANVSSYTVNGSEITVDLTGVANAQELMITIDSVSDGTDTGSVQVPMNVLLGDTNGDGFVNTADAQQTRNRSGDITSASFRSDVNADGAVNSADAIIVRGRSGSSLPESVSPQTPRFR